MFIAISQLKDRYTFEAGFDERDEPGARFSSVRDAHLVANLPCTYASFGEAHAAAQKIVDSRPSHIMARTVCFFKSSSEAVDFELNPEDSAIAHYAEQLAIIQERLSGLNDGDDEERSRVDTEIKGLKADMESLIEAVENEENQDELKGMIAQTSRMESEVSSDEDPEEGEMSDLEPIKASCDAAMLAIQPSHPNAYVKGAYSWDGGVFAIIASAEDGDVLRLSFDGTVLNGVTPIGITADRHPYHKTSFYDRYWDPVVRAVGRIAIPGSGCVIVADDVSGGYNGFRESDNKPVRFKVSSSSGTWWINKDFQKHGASKFSEDQIKPGMEVRCSAKHLPSYYGRTGEVTDVKPKIDYAEVRVDFRRGLGALWLEDSDIEPVELP